MPELEIVDVPARRLFAVAHRGPYTEIGRAFGRLADLLAEHGLTRAAGGLVGVYYDDPTVIDAADLCAEAGVIVDDAVACPPGLDEIRLAAGRHAVLRVAGPYTGLYPAYVWLYSEGLAAAGLESAAGPSFEVYRNDPSDTPPDGLITDIFVPIV